ncbi:MAG: hypothetical protein U5P41_07165 [Gammaproteobacteria bacterium]|nr:hypothetical protein [Gammaproteobacteria bacterium]
MMFIDSDIAFTAQDVLNLAALAAPDSEYAIVCGAYPKKRIAWDQLWRAIENGLVNSADDLQRYAGDFALNTTAGELPDRGYPLRVREAATGFMMIRREVFERMREAFPDLACKIMGGGSITAFFDSRIDPDTNELLPEDYSFCRRASALGFQTWICPWIRLQHIGTYVFDGDLLSVLGVQE